MVFADREDMKKFHGALKTVYGIKNYGASPLLSVDGCYLGKMERTLQ